MKKIFNSDLEDFLYGNTCENSSVEYINVATNGKRNFSKIPVRLDKSKTAATPTCYGVIDKEKVLYASAAQAISTEQIRYQYQWQSEIQDIRKLLKISHEDLAKIFQTSKQTMINLEKGETKVPQKKILEKLEIFLELKKIICSLRNDRMYQVRAFFNSPNLLLNDQSPIEYLKNGDEFALNDVLGLALRIKK